MTPAALRQLAGLADVRKVRELARLDALLTEDRRLAAEIAELAATGVRDLASDAALPLGRQALRLAWAEQRIALARWQRTALAAEIAAARRLAAVSLGKHQALERLTEASDRASAQVRAARAEREAPPAAAPRGPEPARRR
jgi:hypothetical protein